MNNPTLLINEVNSNELDEAQKRIIKTINVLIMNTLNSEEESELFESGASLMRLCANVIRQSKFIQNTKHAKINYQKQSIEYAIDSISELMDERELISYDH